MKHSISRLKKTGCIAFALFLSLLGTVCADDSAFDTATDQLDPNQVMDPTGQALKTPKADVSDLADHKASVFSVEGDVKILKKGSEQWEAAKSGTKIQEGDKILTGADAYAEVAYDDQFLNLARINEKTQAEFISIEPTNLKLSDGSLFNALDGLAKGSEYKVTTPVAVAAVRGTHFTVEYAADTKEFSAATVPVPEDGHESAIEVTQMKTDGTDGVRANLPEGSEVKLLPGQNLDPAMIKPMDPTVVEKYKEQTRQTESRADKFQAQDPASVLKDRRDDKAPFQGPGGPPNGNRPDSTTPPTGSNPPLKQEMPPAGTMPTKLGDPSAMPPTGGTTPPNGMVPSPSGYMPPMGYMPPPDSANMPPNGMAPSPSGYMPPTGYMPPPDSANMPPMGYMPPPDSANMPPTGYMPPPDSAYMPPTGYMPPPDSSTMLPPPEMPPPPVTDYIPPPPTYTNPDDANKTGTYTPPPGSTTTTDDKYLGGTTP